MIFYLIHHLIRCLPFGNKWSEARLNCLTLVLGGCMYFVLYGFLTEYSTKGFFKIMKDFWIYFAFVDMVTMAILYRNFFGRPIMAEIDNTPGEWEYDEDNHRYQPGQVRQVKEALNGQMGQEVLGVIKREHQKTMVEKENIKKELEELVDDKLEEVEEMGEEFVDQMEEKMGLVTETVDKVDALEEGLNDLNQAFLYRPEGDIAKMLKEDFDSRVAECEMSKMLKEDEKEEKVVGIK